jgi:hypothetical protein
MRFEMTKGFGRIQDLLSRRGRSDTLGGPAYESLPVVPRPTVPAGGPASASSARPVSAGQDTPEGWHLSPTTPVLRVANPDPGMAAERPAYNLNKPLPPTPTDSPRSGSPQSEIAPLSVVYSEPSTPIDEPRPALRLMNPDPPSPPESPLEAPARRVPNFSRPFGPDNPFPDRPFEPAPRPAPYRAGLDPRSPLYRGEPLTSVPLTPFTNFRPARQGRPLPPLRIVIPGDVRNAAGHASLAGSPPWRPPAEARDPVSPFPRPLNPTPHHPLNRVPLPPEPVVRRTGRPDSHLLATAPGLPTIREVDETPARAPVRRKPAPPLPPDLVPAPARGRSWPRALRWLDFRAWSRRAAP